MSKRNKLLAVLSSIAVVLICAIAVCLFVLPKNSNTASESYLKQIEIGKNYVQSGSYEQAITAYKAAIEEDKTQDEAYVALAQLYSNLNKLDDARFILSEGLKFCDSKRLQYLYASYFGDSERVDLTTKETKIDVSKSATNVKTNFNESICKVFANYTYDDYRLKYGALSGDVNGNLFTVDCPAAHAMLYFENTEEEKVFDVQSGAVFPNVRPSYVVLSSISYMLSGIENGKKYGVTFLHDLGAKSVETGYDTERGNYIKFEYLDCIVSLGCDKNNEFTTSSWAQVASVFGTGADNEEEQLFDIEVKFVNATDGKSVDGADIAVKSLEDSTTDDYKTNENGVLSASLKQGEYKLSFSKDGYIDEEFDFKVFSTGKISDEKFTVSQEIAAGEIRITLEWNAEPRDLDSHLMISKDGANIGEVSFSYRSVSDNGVLIADLDLDDVDGYGPETVTIHPEASGYDFSYYVKNFSGSTIEGSGATVKVYMPGKSVEVFELPEEIGEINPWWHVFVIEDGVLKDSFDDSSMDFGPSDAYSISK